VSHLRPCHAPESEFDERLPVTAPRKLALGIERMGLVSLRYPWITALVFVALLAAGVAGFMRLRSTIRSASCSAPIRPNTRPTRK